MSRRRSFGAVRQRPTGKWEARYRNAQGEVLYRYFMTKAEATSHLALTEADMLRGDWLDPRLGAMTVEEWAEKFMASKRKIRTRTHELYDYMLRVHIVPTFGSWQLAHITTDDVETWMTSLGDNPKLAASTELKALRLFSQMMEQAVRHRRIAFNPCQHVEAPTQSEREMLFLSAEQVADLAETIGLEHRAYRTLVLLAAYGGLRWGECVGLPVRHLDVVRSRVRVEQQLHKDGRIDAPKSQKGIRTVQVPPWLTAELKATLDARTPSKDLAPEHSDLLFLTPEGRAMYHPSNFNRRTWRPAVTKALPPSLAKLRFHDLRHTAVAITLSSAAAAGHPLNPKQLQERMGHSTIRLTLDRYGHLFDGHDDKVVEAMADPFANRKPRHLTAVPTVA